MIVTARARDGKKQRKGFTPNRHRPAQSLGDGVDGARAGIIHNASQPTIEIAAMSAGGLRA